MTPLTTERRMMAHTGKGVLRPSSESEPDGDGDGPGRPLVRDASTVMGGKERERVVDATVGTRVAVPVPGSAGPEAEGEERDADQRLESGMERKAKGGRAREVWANEMLRISGITSGGW
jgi:hypothetical protein